MWTCHLWLWVPCFCLLSDGMPSWFSWGSKTLFLMPEWQYFIHRAISSALFLSVCTHACEHARVHLCVHAPSKAHGDQRTTLILRQDLLWVDIAYARLASAWAYEHPFVHLILTSRAWGYRRVLLGFGIEWVLGIRILVLICTQQVLYPLGPLPTLPLEISK